MTGVDASIGGAFADQAFAAAAGAYQRTPESWERAVHAAIDGLFSFLSGRPAQTSACIVAECGTESAASGHRDRTIDRFTQLLEPGFRIAVEPPPPIVAEAIGGGIYELVRSHVLERRLEQLPSAVPDATIVALSPFVGQRAAAALASSCK